MKLLDNLNNGGVLAVQMPLVQYAPFYRALEELKKENKWKKISGIKVFHNLLPEETYDILTRCSSDVTMWETTYYHVVQSHKDVLEWYKGSGLRPYLDVLNDAEKEIFISELTGKIESLFTVREDNRILLKMPRLFFTAVK